MKLTDKVLLKVYAAVLASVSTVATQKLLAAGWEFVTGEKPPEPGDPEVSGAAAFTWVLASAVGYGVSQLAVQRATARMTVKRGGLRRSHPLQIKI
ncbi:MULTISPECIES: DUF4235 domain-containing protein [Aestuariimicrobium]|uniref:DUF4235 domain-containing protein n=1 Tax=Aestuariimicrobium TaxID=396388 RepID=UPI0003F8C3C6|nr:MULTISPECIES: DUF4235 domain-containing protein [Aestuariimicrobium]CAI9408740.1 hypothetical protein AESSP_02088 [Aestuariimicrobium sp. T2.26MG-19.2B]